MNEGEKFHEVQITVVGNGFLIVGGPQTAEPKQYVARTYEEVCAVVKDILAEP